MWGSGGGGGGGGLCWWILCGGWRDRSGLGLLCGGSIRMLVARVRARPALASVTMISSYI